MSPWLRACLGRFGGGVKLIWKVPSIPAPSGNYDTIDAESLVHFKGRLEYSDFYFPGIKTFLHNDAHTPRQFGNDWWQILPFKCIWTIFATAFS